MAFLYRNHKGKEVSLHSYSAGGDFRRCPAYYQLKRVHGWREREQRATSRFGDAIETAIRFFHEHDRQAGSAANEFQVQWEKVRQIQGLEYKDDTWEEMLSQGRQMGRLYELRHEALGIHHRMKDGKLESPKFQLNFKKEVFPSSYLSGIEFTAYVDMLDTDESGKRTIIDIKTSGVDLKSGMLNLDPQLKSYAWVSGFPDVAFLWFQRAGLSFKRGDTVSVIGDFELLSECDHQLRIIEINKDEGTVIVLPQSTYEEYQSKSSGLRGKYVDTARESFSMMGIKLKESEVTKQRLSIHRATITPEEAKEQGEEIGLQIAEIVSAREQQKYPHRGGIRWPNDGCVTCPMRGICGHNDKLRDELLVAPDGGDDKTWLDE